MEVLDATSARAVWPVNQAAHSARAGQAPAASPAESGRVSNPTNPVGEEHATSATSSGFHDNWNVQIARDEPANQIWINIVDQATGQIVMKIPPEALREAQLQMRVSGSVTNLRG